MHIFIQERLYKLIYVYTINMIIKSGIWQSVKFQLVSFLIKNELIFLLYL